MFVRLHFLYTTKYVLILMQEDDLVIFNGYYPKLTVLHIAELPKFVSAVVCATDDVLNMIFGRNIGGAGRPL